MVRTLLLVLALGGCTVQQISDLDGPSSHDLDQARRAQQLEQIQRGERYEVAHTLQPVRNLQLELVEKFGGQEGSPVVPPPEDDNSDPDDTPPSPPPDANPADPSLSGGGADIDGDGLQNDVDNDGTGQFNDAEDDDDTRDTGDTGDTDDTGDTRDSNNADDNPKRQMGVLSGK